MEVEKDVSDGWLGWVCISGVGAQKTDFFVPTSQLRCQLGFMRNSGVGVNKTDFYVTSRWVKYKTDFYVTSMWVKYKTDFYVTSR